MNYIANYLNYMTRFENALADICNSQENLWRAIESNYIKPLELADNHAHTPIIAARTELPRVPNNAKQNVDVFINIIPINDDEQIQFKIYTTKLTH